MRPQLPVQPNPNPNNKAVQNVDIATMLLLYITPVSCEAIHLRFGWIAELIIEEGASSESNKESNDPQPLPTSIPAGPAPHDADTVAEKTVAPADPPFPERLTLSKAVEQPHFNLLRELQNLYIKIPLL